jgi:hypothetical protein
MCVLLVSLSLSRCFYHEPWILPSKFIKDLLYCMLPHVVSPEPHWVIVTFLFWTKIHEEKLSSKEAVNTRLRVRESCFWRTQSLRFSSWERISSWKFNNDHVSCRRVFLTRLMSLMFRYIRYMCALHFLHDSSYTPWSAFLRIQQWFLFRYVYYSVISSLKIELLSLLNPIPNSQCDSHPSSFFDLIF